MAATLLMAVALASGGILSPGSILLTLLILSSPAGPSRALAYYAGYFGAYVTLGITIVLVNGLLQADARADEPSLAAGWVSVVIGALALVLALRSWRAPRDAPSRPPKIFASVDTMGAAKLFGLGALVSIINVKNLSLYLSAIAVVVEGRLPSHQAVLAVVVTAFVFCLAVLGPILALAVGQARAQPLLQRLRTKIERGSRTMMVAVLIGLACVMLTRGLLELYG